MQLSLPAYVSRAILISVDKLRYSPQEGGEYVISQVCMYICMFVCLLEYCAEWLDIIGIIHLNFVYVNVQCILDAKQDKVVGNYRIMSLILME